MLKFAQILILLFAVAPAQAGFRQSCERILLSTWRAVFPEAKVVQVAGRSFRVYSSAIGHGGEGIVWRLYDEPARKVKIFTPSPESSQAQEGFINLARIGLLPQGYIEGWVKKIENLRAAGFVLPLIHEVGRGFVVMEFIDGVPYKKLGTPELGYDSAEIKRIQALYWDVIRRASRQGTLDGADGFNNLLWEPRQRRWIIIDP